MCRNQDTEVKWFFMAIYLTSGLGLLKLKIHALEYYIWRKEFLAYNNTNWREVDGHNASILSA